MPNPKNRLPFLAACVAAGTFACGHPPAAARLSAPAPNAFPPDCIAAGAGTRHDSIRVVGDGAVSSQDAPVPRSGAEQIAFGLAYETLLRLDCQGNAAPGLATMRPGRDEVALVLRRDARFWDGAPVLAADVLAAWRLRDSALAVRASALGDSVVVIATTGFPDAVPEIVAPRAAVTKPAPDQGWPIGTGDRWITGDGTSAATVQSVSPGAAPRVLFVPGTEDARDALEGHADVVVTDDRAALAYAATRPGYAVLPLAWSEEYVLIAPDPVAVDRGDLAAAVRVDAAPADNAGCPATRPRRATVSGPRRIAYRQGDPAAEALAARLIGSGAVGRGVFALALRGAEWGRAAQDGSEWGLIERVRVPASCGESWGAATPLIAVRSTAVVDKTLLPLPLGSDGAPRLGERQ